MSGNMASIRLEPNAKPVFSADPSCCSTVIFWHHCCNVYSSVYVRFVLQDSPASLLTPLERKTKQISVFLKVGTHLICVSCFYQPMVAFLYQL